MREKTGAAMQRKGRFEHANGGTLTGYLDGEIAGVQRLTTVKSGVATSQTLQLDKQGDVLIGGSITGDGITGVGFAGLVSRVTFFNYDLNADDVYGLYLQGPMDNLLARMGLAPYGVRSPIYRIDDEIDATGA